MYQAARCVPALLVALAAALACGPDLPPVSGRASEGLVFVRLVGDGEDLVRARLADGAEAALTETPDRRERWPAWSTAANALVYEVLGAPADARSDLMVWSAEDGTLTRLTETPVRRETWASWSPVGRRVAYAYRGPGLKGGIAIRDLGQKSALPVVRAGEEAHFFRPHFDPQGRRIVAQRKAPRGGSHLWIVGWGMKPRPLTRDAAWFDLKGFFSRDGKRIVYSRRPLAGGPHQIASIDPAGESLLVLGGSDGAGDDHSARPSPTRDEVVFVSDRDGTPDLYLADLDGGGARRLTRTPERSEFAPRWSPDGERIVATVQPAASDPPRLEDPEGLAELRVVVFDREGTALLDAPGYMPDWMPAWE